MTSTPETTPNDPDTGLPAEEDENGEDETAEDENGDAEE